MIIDLILDRKADMENYDDNSYSANSFYHRIREYEEDLGIDYISKAMDYGNNTDVQHALINYLVDLGYYHDPALITWIKNTNWI